MSLVKAESVSRLLMQDQVVGAALLRDLFASLGECVGHDDSILNVAVITKLLTVCELGCLKFAYRIEDRSPFFSAGVAKG